MYLCFVVFCRFLYRYIFCSVLKCLASFLLFFAAFLIFFGSCFGDLFIGVGSFDAAVKRVFKSFASGFKTAINAAANQVKCVH